MPVVLAVIDVLVPVVLALVGALAPVGLAVVCILVLAVVGLPLELLASVLTLLPLPSALELVVMFSDDEAFSPPVGAAVAVLAGGPVAGTCVASTS